MRTVLRPLVLLLMLLLLLSVSPPIPAQAATPQTDEATARAFVAAQRASMGLSESDIADLRVARQYTDQGITHVTFQQYQDGIRVHNA